MKASIHTLGQVLYSPSQCVMLDAEAAVEDVIA